MEQQFFSWAQDVFWEEVKDHVLVCSDKPGTRAIRLNPEASAVWRLCDGTRSVGEMVKELLRQYEAEPQVITRQVGTLIGELASKGLLSRLDEPREITREELQADAVIFRDAAVWARQVGSEFTILDNRCGVAYSVGTPDVERIWTLTNQRPTVEKVLDEIEREDQRETHLARAWGRIYLRILQERGWVRLGDKSEERETPSFCRAYTSARSNFGLQFHFTGRCNLRCRHCYEDGAVAGEMTIDERIIILEKFLRQAADWDRVPRIALTGGEPLLDRDLWVLLDYLEDHSLMDGTMAVLTNGTLMDDSIADRFTRYRKLNQVQVSLDGATRATHDAVRGEGAFDAAVRAVGLLLEKGIYTAIHFVVHKGNYRDAFRMTNLAKELSADSLLITRLVPWGRGKEMQASMLTPEEVRELYLKLVEDEKELASRRTDGNAAERLRVVVKNRCDFPLLFSDTTDPEQLVWNGRHCVIGLNHLTVMQDGTAYACRRLPRAVGNLLHEGFQDIWSHDFLWKMRCRHSFMQGKCTRCRFFTDPKYRVFCWGGAACIANGYYGDPFHPDPQCSYQPSALGE
jgi:MoaA/NifB/PqqE/SkfB family radical SAM enzyme